MMLCNRKEMDPLGGELVRLPRRGYASPWIEGQRNPLADQYEPIHQPGSGAGFVPPPPPKFAGFSSPRRLVRIGQILRTHTSNADSQQATHMEHRDIQTRRPTRSPRARSKQSLNAVQYFARVCAMLFAVLFTGFACAQETTEKQDREQILAAMRKAADKVTITAEGRAVAKRIDEPLFRFDDPARKFDDGSIWAWGQAGRPLALVTIARNSPSRWMVETVSFADTPIKANQRSLTQPFKMQPLTGVGSGVGAPRNSVQLRKSQLKLLARKFQAFQMWDNDGATKLQRYELRLLTKPVLQYTDEANGILSGAVFLFNYGSNPELAMIVEAHQDGWNCGFGRMGWAAATVQFDKKAIFQQPKLRSGMGDARYAMSFLSAN